MKRTLALLSLVAMLAPGIAFAQTAAPAMPGGPSQQGPQRPHLSATQRQAMMQAMRHVRDQIKAVRHQAHAQALAALSPAHRAVLINLLGQAAISEKPDHKALPAKLDAVLSPSEKAAILSIASATRAKERTIMETAHKQMISQLPADVQQKIAAHMAQMKQNAAKHKKHTPDAGRALLALVTHRRPDEMMEHRGMFGQGRMGHRGPGGPGMGAGHGPGGPGSWGPRGGQPPPAPPASPAPN